MTTAKAKLRGRHSTCIIEAAHLRQWARNVESIKGIALGLIRPVGGARSPRALKLTQEQGCILVQVRGHTAIQDIRLYSDDIPALDRALVRYGKDNLIVVRR